ncbi:ABC transporter ATP-binding protein [Ruminococcus flavefaciens]|uniref:Energy-coupling factor transport system ATP-binding protein n=1 Tax=Ruminococcus flavefaciens TaxID=1265 RepID=A0A1M7K4T1_RUMFL|nr:energy-coupling factor ABC transporter ATP-binding protein [Ruminococcus flavefaciens]SHM60268.1 energy-coupling factor transport system ATP-binding protein [Ruminococcus flavefaciens]
MIEFKNVSFSYSNDGSANGGGCLKNIDLKINKGEAVVLSGESGCGKTTITRLINGLIPYYYEGTLTGDIIINGKNSRDMSLYDISKNTGSVFQNPRSQFFNVDTDSELAFSCENQGMPVEEIKRRIKETVELFGIQRLMHRSIFDMSGGEKQIIACAAVSVADPDIIVLDEPSSNLDMRATAELKKCIRIWKSQKKTIIIAEHRLRYLSDIADRVFYIREGRIENSFTFDELREKSFEELKSLGLRPVTDDQFKKAGNAVSESQNGLTLKNFAFAYKRSAPVLKIEECSIPFGQITAVIGNNGAGKSTFSRCLCGLVKKCKGIAEYNDNTLKRRDRLKKSFMVMQDVNNQLFTESVLDEVMISMEEEKNDKAIEILRSLDLEELSDRHPASLSGGQKQRCAIACAIASNKEIMIFDEPTSGLDLRHMYEVADNIRFVNSDDRCIIVVSHDLELILSCCTYVVRLEKGEVIEHYPLDSNGIGRLVDFFEEPFRSSSKDVS